MRLCAVLCLVFGLLVAVGLALTATMLMSVFVNDEQVITVGVMYLIIVPLSFGAQGVVRRLQWSWTANSGHRDLDTAGYCAVSAACLCRQPGVRHGWKFLQPSRSPIWPSACWATSGTNELVTMVGKRKRDLCYFCGPIRWSARRWALIPAAERQLHEHAVEPALMLVADILKAADQSKTHCLVQRNGCAVL